MPDEKTPLDQALDLLVFAPLGLALTARDHLPEMVEKGRSRVESQMTMAKFVGQFAVNQGKAELEKRLKPYTEPKPAAQPETDASAGANAEPEAEAKVEGEPAGIGPIQDARPIGTPTNGSGPKAVDLAIPGYDSLSASQVVQRLPGLSPTELEDVRHYETANRGRKTVLSHVSQLQA